MVSRSVSKPEKLVFMYWPWPWPSGTTEAELITQFEQDWGIRVERVIEPDYEPMLLDLVNTRHAAGGQIDVIKGLMNWLGDWIDPGVIQSIDGLRGLQDYKQDMNDLCRQCVEHEGKTWGLPYYQNFFTAVYFEDLFDKGGVTAPPTNWDELVCQALKLKKDGVAQYPILWPAGQGGTEQLTYVFYQLVHNWGGTVFDEELRPSLGPGSKARDALAWWHKTFHEWEISAPESLEYRFIPAVKAFWTGKYSHHLFTRAYYMRYLNHETESPIRGRVHQWFLPNGGATLGWTAFYALGSNTRSPEWAWKLLQYMGGKTKDGQYTIAKRYAMDTMLGSGFDPVNRDAEVQAAWKKWTDVELNMRQWERATAVSAVVPAMMKPWFRKWQEGVMAAVWNCLAGKTTADRACDEMIARYHEVVG